jgi:glycosyltransferase involved in cell wall biosynthesis
MIKPPTISVIVPAFNAEKTLEFAIDSALNQTYPATQIIVVDNNSTDKTVEIARKFGARILIVNCQEHGVSKARVSRRKKGRARGLDSCDIRSQLPKQYHICFIVTIDPSFCCKPGRLKS